MSEKPTNIYEYQNWLRDTHNVHLAQAKIHYDSVVHKIHADVQRSDLWGQLNNSLTTLDQLYLLKTRSPLLVNYKELELKIKPFDSFLEKTFRKNVVENDNWPKPPNSGWLLPENWIKEINDVVRTLLVVKYIDGVLYAAEEITQHFRSNDLYCTKNLEARTEGYYAAHLYVLIPVEIPRISWDTDIVDISVEIQITTQIQEVIRDLLHVYYEERRTATNADIDALPWQWDHKKLEFSANYLGHVLHYMDGMIVEIRDRQEFK